VCLVLLLIGPGTASPSRAQAPNHGTWDALLVDCVQSIDGGASTAVAYGCFARERSRLESYLASLARVSREDFDALPRDDRLAFLINTYNAWTVELILGAWPDVASIRDLGSLFRSPWKRAFIPLFGEEVSLDDIEHGMIREPGRYDEPRIHFAVNCASVSCPALRREAYDGRRLEAQLEDQTRRFLGDRSRNRLRDGRLEVSSIFKWYAEDFAAGWRGLDSVSAFLAAYGPTLDLDARQQAALRAGDLALSYLPYDWSLNDPP
jgi:hypothetical protein